MPRLNSFTPRKPSSTAICRLTALSVRYISAAARAKLSWRAADSNSDKATVLGIFRFMTDRGPWIEAPFLTRTSRGGTYSSTWMRAARTTAPQRAFSLFTKAPKSRGAMFEGV